MTDSLDDRLTSADRTDGLVLNELGGAGEGAVPLGIIYAVELGDPDAAEDAYRAGIAAGDPYAHHNLGGRLEERGDLHEAINHYRMAAADGDDLARLALRRLGDGH